MLVVIAHNSDCEHSEQLHALRTDLLLWADLHNQANLLAVLSHPPREFHPPIRCAIGNLPVCQGSPGRNRGSTPEHSFGPFSPLLSAKRCRRREAGVFR